MGLLARGVSLREGAGVAMAPLVQLRLRDWLGDGLPSGWLGEARGGSIRPC